MSQETEGEDRRVVPFVRPASRPSERPLERPSGDCTILLFTGVRYERKVAENIAPVQHRLEA